MVGKKLYAATQLLPRSGKTAKEIIALAAVGVTAQAALNTQDFQTRNMSATVMTNRYTVTVEANDAVVMTAASNKKDSVSPITFSSSAGTLMPVNTSATDPYPAAYSAYLIVETGGTYDFTAVAGGALTAKTDLRVLRADSREIIFLDSATFVNDDANSMADQTLTYDWGGSAVTNAMSVEAVSSRTSLINATGEKRLITATPFSGTNLTTTYSFSAGTVDKMTSSGVGLAFAEADATPAAPTFNSNPIVEMDAVQGELYSSSIADNASDPNGDAMTFLKIPGGPSWLTVSANGTLSGTPDTGDVGTSSWAVSVTDNITGTNSTTLKINVLSGPPTPQTDQTNFVFVVIDDLGWMDLGVQGSAFYETPRIDALAAGGMRFTQGYTPHPRCLPARYGFITGRFPGANGVPGGPENNLRPTEVTIAETFQTNGYATCFAGKWHLIGTHGADNLPQNQGFDVNFAGGKAGAPPTYFYPYRKPGNPAPTDELTYNLYFEKDGVPGEYITDRLTDECLKWIKWNADKPMFLALWHYGVHTPFEAPAGLVAKYTAKLATMEYGDLPEYIPAGIGQQKMRQNHPIYAAMIESIDTSIGRLLDQLDELGIAGNTVIVFTSDNGGLSNRGGHNTRELATANNPLRTGKGWLYEGGIREAFIVKGPGIPAMLNTNAVVTGTDIYPTLLELAGLPLEPGNHLDGVSFAPALRGETYDRGKPIFWHSPLARPYSTGDFNSSAIRDGDYKLIWFYDTPGQPYELYNVKTDIGENNNLAGTLPDIATNLLAKIQAWHTGAHGGSGIIFKVDDNDVARPPSDKKDGGQNPPLSLKNSGEQINLSWGDWIGYSYKLWSRTNLLKGDWVATPLTTNSTPIVTDEPQGFYKVEIVLQPEN